FPVRFKFLYEGKPVPVRVYLRLNGQSYQIDSLGYRLPIHLDGHYHDRIFEMKPSIQVLDLMHQGEHHWYFLTGEAVLPMLPGSYEIAVYKGMEFLPIHASFDLSDKVTEKTFTLKRWIDNAKHGWYGGDDHIHLTRQEKNNGIFLNMMEADGLSMAHFLQLQRRDQAAVQYAWGQAGQARNKEYIIRSGEEQRSPFYGHNLMLGIDSLVPPVSLGLKYGLTPYADPLTPDLFRHARRLNGVIGYAHDDGGEEHSAAMIDIVHGDVDFLEVFQFGRMRSRFWYIVLSCGFRMPGAAGSDFPVNLGLFKPWPKLLPLFGPERMYVKLDPPLSYAKWMSNLKKGRILLTNGPMVELEVNNTQPGGEVRLREGENMVDIHALIRHWRPMRVARLIVNGRVHRTYRNQASTEWEIRDRVDLPRSAWVAMHVMSDSTTGLGDEEILLQAHTNPVYVVIGERMIGDPETIQFALDELEAQREYFTSNRLLFLVKANRQRLLERVDTTLAELRSRLAEARR
ncbi:MAG: CehA/McbA family metallohydrolase, partial [Gemmatimonadota bacterium]|nr:CehA/McbA family metallohydrolase [Gemmatimonadota bacterium]